MIISADLVLDLFLTLVKRLRIKEAEYFAHLDEMLELDFDFLEQRDPVTHVFLFDLCAIDQLIDSLVDSLDLRVCGTHRAQVLVEDTLHLVRL